MLALLLLSAGFATAQESGAGVSKSTFAASRPKEGMQFLLDYLPVSVAQDECAKDRCNCSWLGDSFSVLQGRVSLHERGEGGFGLHLEPVLRDARAAITIIVQQQVLGVVDARLLDVVARLLGLDGLRGDDGRPALLELDGHGVSEAY